MGMGIIVRQERCLISSPTVSQISPTPASFIGSALRIPNACSHLRQAAQALASTSCDDLTCNPRSPTLNCCQPCVRHAERRAAYVVRMLCSEGDGSNSQSALSIPMSQFPLSGDGLSWPIFPNNS